MPPLLRRALLALGVAVALGGPPARAQAPDPPLRAVLANGYRFAYLERGGGRPVVLVHGALDDYRLWDGLGVELADTARVIAYSRRYHFPNPHRPDDPPADLVTHGGDLAAILRALHLEKVVLVASGGGAAVAVRAALREPRLVAGVVLVEPRVGVALGDSTPPDSLERPDPIAVREQESILPEALRGPDRPLTCDEVRRLSMPLHLIGGGDSGRHVAAGIGGTQRCHPGSTVEQLPGRDLPRTGTAMLAAALARFLVTLPR